MKIIARPYHRMHAFALPITKTSKCRFSVILSSWLVVSCCMGTLLNTNFVVAEEPESPVYTSFRESLKAECYAALAKRRENFEKLDSAESLKAWQEQRCDFFLEQLGAFPERPPLNAQVVGELNSEDYRVEKILFESQPRHHVTANLYLPVGEGPFPAVIIPCGHSYNGKAAEGYQRVSILMAKNGIAAMCYDPIGQGERYQTFADGKPLSAEYPKNPNSLRQLEEIPEHPNFDPVEEHTLVGIGSILVGRNTATYRIFDGMRCIDYLLSRKDIDPTRIGCTGNSGGGTLTAYLMALDERIYCAAPACYLTTFERLIATNGPQDAEQNIFGQIAFGMDQADYVLMRAPRPTCLLAGTRDATFDIQGTWEIFREGKRGYARHGHPERMDMVEADAPHGFTTQLRVGSVRWMRRWLLERDDAVTEPDFPVWAMTDLQCTPRGQVMLLDGERSVFDLNRAEAERLASVRNARWSRYSADEKRNVVRRVIGVPTLEDIPKMNVRVMETDKQTDDVRREKLSLEREGKISLTAWRFTPLKPSGEITIYLHEEGKEIDGKAREAIDQLLQDGHMVLAVDLSGIGETEPNDSEGKRRTHWSRALFGPDAESFWIAYLLGKSLIGIRTEEILAIARTFGDERHQPQIISVGRVGLPALHAFVLEPQIFSSLTVERSLAAWSDVVTAPLGYAHLSETVHGVLREYDLPDLMELTMSERIKIVDPVQPH